MARRQPSFAPPFSLRAKGATLVFSKIDRVLLIVGFPEGSFQRHLPHSTSIQRSVLTEAEWFGAGLQGLQQVGKVHFQIIIIIIIIIINDTIRTFREPASTFKGVTNGSPYTTKGPPLDTP